MKTIEGFVVLAVAGTLAACGKSVPSCGDKAATDMVKSIVTNGVLKDTNDLKDEIQKRLTFTVDQPIIVKKDDALSSYSCRAVASYHVSDELINALHQFSSDAEYRATVFGNWRKLMGLYSTQDVGMLTTRYAQETEETTKAQLRGDLLRALNISDNSVSDKDIALAVMVFAQQNSDKQLNAQAKLLEATLDATDEKSKTISVPIEYSISKIDGEQKFRIDVRSDQADLFRGVQDIEVLQSAVLLTKQEAVKAASRSSVNSTEHPATPKVAEVESSPATTNAESSKAPDSSASSVTATEHQSLIDPDPVKSKIETSQPVAVGASFDCAKAASKIEKLICSSPETAAADRALAEAYSAARSRSNDVNALKLEQRNWLTTQRNECADAACLLSVIQARTQTLGGV